MARPRVSKATLAVMLSLAAIVAVTHGTCAADLFVDAADHRREALKTVDHFMRLMRERKLGAAEALFSSRGSAGEVIDGVRRLGSAENRVLFERYQGVLSRGQLVKRSPGCMASRHTIELEGDVSYDDGSHGRFSAKLIRESGGWALLGINVATPPVKRPRTSATP